MVCLEQRYIYWENRFTYSSFLTNRLYYADMKELADEQRGNSLYNAKIP
jgi:hypothetical protein